MCEGTVYVMETPEDFDKYAEMLGDECIRDCQPNFYVFKDEFTKYKDRIWQDKSQLRYEFNGMPKYEEYKVIAIEDNTPCYDWYWVVQNTDDERDIKYINVLMFDPDDLL